MTENLILSGFFFLFGIIIGSFLNVCVVRLPHEKSVVRPRSHCTKCKKMIPWYDNIPLLSFIILGGRCRYCKEKFSFRYFMIELLTGVVFVLYYHHFKLSAVLLPYVVMTCGFIIATFVDFEHRIIPDEVSVGGMCVGLIFSLLIPELHGVAGVHENVFLNHFHSLGLSLLGVLIGGGMLYATGMLGDFLFKKESIGGGDIKLLAMIGAFMGWKLSILSFFIGCFFGAVYGIVEKIRTKDSAIAFGPFLVLGAIFCLFGSEQIIAWIMSGYGLY